MAGIVDRLPAFEDRSIVVEKEADEGRQEVEVHNLEEGEAHIHLHRRIGLGSHHRFADGVVDRDMCFVEEVGGLMVNHIHQAEVQEGQRTRQEVREEVHIHLEVPEEMHTR